MFGRGRYTLTICFYEYHYVNINRIYEVNINQDMSSVTLKITEYLTEMFIFKGTVEVIKLNMIILFETFFFFIYILYWIFRAIFIFIFTRIHLNSAQFRRISERKGKVIFLFFSVAINNFSSFVPLILNSLFI